MGVYLSRSRNAKISYWIKKLNYLAFFPTQICAIRYSRTFFIALSPCYVYYFLDSVFSLPSPFFQQRTFLIQKLWYFFKLAKFNLIFYFLQLMQALTLYVPEKMWHTPKFLILIFDYQVIFKNYMMYWSRMYWSNDLRIY